MAQEAVRDIFVVGGGINGCGIARDAAGRGYSVTLAEMKDFASGTSSGATKLIHAGSLSGALRVPPRARSLDGTRSSVGHGAPHHLANALRSALPQGWHSPAWLIRLGLFLYDHLGGRKLLPATKSLDMRRDPAANVEAALHQGLRIFDGWVDDARLVVLNARDAADRGADIMNRSKVISVRRGMVFGPLTCRTSRAAT